MMGLAAKIWWIGKNDGVQFCWSVPLWHMAISKKQDLASLVHPLRQYMRAASEKGCLINLTFLMTSSEERGGSWK